MEVWLKCINTSISPFRDWDAIGWDTLDLFGMSHLTFFICYRNLVHSGLGCTVNFRPSNTRLVRYSDGYCTTEMNNREAISKDQFS